MEITDDLVLAMITLILILGTLFFLFFMVWPEINSQPLTCSTDFCKTNVYTGEKVCPVEGGIIEFNPAYEVCNARQGCTNYQTPCVYLSTEEGTSCPGDPGYDGLCPDGQACDCLDRRVCPDWVTAYFQPQVLYNQGVESYTAYIQKTVWTTPTDAPSTNIPISVGEYTQPQGLCGINDAYYNRIWPVGPDCVRGKLGRFEGDGLWYCMDTQTTCSTGTLYRDIQGTYFCG